MKTASKRQQQYFHIQNTYIQLLHTKQRKFLTQMHCGKSHLKAQIISSTNVTFAEELKHRDKLTNDQVISIGKMFRSENIRSASHTNNKQLKQNHHDLCTNSRLKEIGNPNLIDNLTKFKISITENEALCLGLKFTTGLKKVDIVTTLTKKQQRFRKGVVVGILAATLTNANGNALHRIYIRAMENLSTNKDIIITPSDKGDRIVTMDNNVYIEKLESRLDSNTYTKLINQQ